MKILGFLLTIFGINKFLEKTTTSNDLLLNHRKQFVKNGKDWFPFMNPKLLKGIDTLVETLEYRVLISPHNDSLGRITGSATSQHFYKVGSYVNAADIMFVTKTNESLTREQLSKLYTDIRAMNLFTGIGIYPEWQPYAGMHLDVREDRSVAAPALWGGKKVAGNQKLVDINSVLA